MINLEEVHKYSPTVKLYEHTVPHFHFQTEDKDLPCVETTITRTCEQMECPRKMTVTIHEQPEIKQVLRVVQQFADPEKVPVPVFHYEENDP